MMGLYTEAIDCLLQGLSIACENGQTENEAKIRYRFGLVLLLKQNFKEAQQQLNKALDLFAMIRQEAGYSNDHKVSFFDLETAAYQAIQVLIFIFIRFVQYLHQYLSTSSLGKFISTRWMQSLYYVTSLMLCNWANHFCDLSRAAVFEITILCLIEALKFEPKICIC